MALIQYTCEYNVVTQLIHVPQIHLAGDIHLNPDPVKNPCGVCYRPLAQTHRKMTCDGCYYDYG